MGLGLLMCLCCFLVLFVAVDDGLAVASEAMLSVVYGSSGAY